LKRGGLLTGGGISVSGVLDEAVDLVARGVPGWAGLLALTALPLRFLEAHFVNRLVQLGAGARGALGDATAISWLVTLALLPALWGRAVFVRACVLELGGTAPGISRMPLRQRLRLPPAGFAAYVYTGLVYETLFFALGWTLVALPALALLTGLAAATSFGSPLDEPPGLLASPLRVLRHARPLSTLAGLTAVLAVALLVAFLNLTILFLLLLLLADGTAGLDLSWWNGALSWDNRLFVLLLLAGAVTAVEPFWLAALTVTVRRARARQSGEDLAAWFAGLRRAKVPATAALALLLLLPAALRGAPPPSPISPTDYRGRLAAIDGRLRAGDWVGARDEARRLTAERIAFGPETLQPDLSVLQPLAEARDAKAARAAAPRLGRLVAALDAPRSDPPFERADPKLLGEVRARESLAALPKGKVSAREGAGVLDVLSEVLDPVRRWLDDLWDHIEKWWKKLFPDSDSKKGFLDRLLNLPVTVTVLVVALAAAGGWLAARALRKRRRGQAPVAASVPAPPGADDDPLSRQVDEWELYARELAASGRLREAVRAWYHAVLVALFRTGTLHYRKGRTNWEYISALTPGYVWRAQLMELTRRFEREWYGRATSTPEALDAAEHLARGLLAALREAA
jgi:hypothetical protein